MHSALKEIIANCSILPCFHVPFCLSNNPCLLIDSSPSLDISEINKQGCGLARKRHGNAVFETEKRLPLIESFTFWAEFGSKCLSNFDPNTTRTQIRPVKGALNLNFLNLTINRENMLF